MDFTFDPIDFPLEEMQVGAKGRGQGPHGGVGAGAEGGRGQHWAGQIFTWQHSPGPSLPMQTPMQSLVHELHANGQKFVPILDPGIKVSPGYHAYDVALAQDLFVKNAEGDPYLGWVSVGWAGGWVDVLRTCNPPTVLVAGWAKQRCFVWICLGVVGVRCLL